MCRKATGFLRRLRTRSLTACGSPNSHLRLREVQPRPTSEWCDHVLKMGNGRVANSTRVVIGQRTSNRSVQIGVFPIETRVSISFHTEAVTKLAVEHD